MSNRSIFPFAPAPSSWAHLLVRGDDAEPFLQGQLSTDLRKLGPDAPSWTAYNSPKGRMLAVLQALRRGAQEIALYLPPGLAEPVARRLRLFVLRAKVGIEVCAPRQDDATTERTDRARLIAAGIPVVYPPTQDRWVAQMANLDLLGGVSFDKGCYTGQEVVARLHYLGNLKKRMFRVHGTGAPPPPGTTIRDRQGDGQAVGEIVDAVADGAGFVASAVLQISTTDRDSLVLANEADAALSRPEPYTYDQDGVTAGLRAPG